jgi:hypothetical protein
MDPVKAIFWAHFSKDITHLYFTCSLQVEDLIKRLLYGVT